MSMEDTSFSETCFGKLACLLACLSLHLIFCLFAWVSLWIDAFIFNNCRAMYAGNHSYYDIHYDEFDTPMKESKDSKKTK